MVATARGRSSVLARLAAPAAFLLAATIAVLLVRSAIHAGDGAAVRERTTTAAENETRRTTPARKRQRNRDRSNRTTPTRAFYRVQTGDTFETIAAAHGTTVQRLLELNPGIDPRSLTVGQQVRVR